MIRAAFVALFLLSSCVPSGVEKVGEAERKIEGIQKNLDVQREQARPFLDEEELDGLHE